MAERLLIINGTYRHFKGKKYTVLGTATHTEDHELVVVYAQKEGGKIWARPYKEFMSEVDREKYPEASQRYRFMLVECTACGSLLLVEWIDELSNYRYCPNCGARMDGDSIDK